jgi:pimeloyl-[acyl-carrier protein] methyl ester esterase
MNQAQFLLPDGRVLTWYEQGHGHPLVLLHGWAMSARVFSEIAEMLATDFRLLIPDLPGHGQSSVAAKNDLCGISADLACWLASVVSTPVSLAGWSFGGMLALAMAHQQAIPVDRLMLVGTTPRFTQNSDWAFGVPKGQVHALGRNLLRRFELTLADFFALAFSGEQITPERLREIRNFAVKRSPVPDRDALLGLLEALAGHDQRAVLPSIRQPALVMHGEHDQIVPFAAGRELSEKLPNGHLVNFPGTGHAPFLSQPQAFAMKTREFC